MDHPQRQTTQSMLLSGNIPELQSLGGYEGQRPHSEGPGSVRRSNRRGEFSLGDRKILLYLSQDNTKMEASSAIYWPFLLSGRVPNPLIPQRVSELYGKRWVTVRKPS